MKKPGFPISTSSLGFITDCIQALLNPSIPCRPHTKKKNYHPLGLFIITGIDFVAGDDIHQFLLLAWFDKCPGMIALTPAREDVKLSLIR